MAQWLKINNYRIGSNKIYQRTVAAYVGILAAVFFAELVFDPTPYTFGVVDIANAVSIFIALVSYRRPENQWIRGAVVTSMFILIELRFLISPTFFYSISFWAVLVPLAALIVQGTVSAQLWVVVIMLALVANSVYLREIVGDRYQVNIRVTPFTSLNIIFYGAISSFMFLLYTLMGEAYAKMKSKNKELATLQQEIEHKKNKMQNYHLELLKISKHGTLTASSEAELFKGICQVAAENIGVNRVSIWLMENDGTILTRKFLLQADHQTNEPFTAAKADYPVYFRALESKALIMADEARTHEDTLEFKDEYLVPMNVYSMLDCPIILDTVTIGVISCESVGAPKTWDVEDGLFIQSLADFMAINYKNRRIKKLLNEIKSKNSELVSKNAEIGDMNVELQHLNEELTSVNESLEDIVQQRTIELEKQNTKLKEYAFINSHLLRAPVSRILGASQLIETELKSVQEKELIDELISSTNELDAIIHRIGDVLYEGKNLTRQEIEDIIKSNLNTKA